MNGTNAKNGSKFVIALLLAGLVLGSAGCRKKISGLGIKLEIDRRTLANGLTVIMVEDHTVPVISYQTWYRVGSVDERPGITGISHFFEHLMFKGTPKFGPKEFFSQLEAKGVEVNAYTTRDYTTYYESMGSANPALLEKAIEMEADRMTNLVLDEKTVQTERQVVLEERRLRTDNDPGGKMQEALWALAYHRHPYGWPVIGVPRDLVTMSVEQVNAYYKKHYQPANATIVVVGDFKPDSVFSLIKKYYGPIKGLSKPVRDIPEEWEQKEERRLTLYDGVASERFAQAYHVTAATDDDSYALDVLANILFEGTSSRAYQKLVEEKGVALGVSGVAFTPTYPGLFSISGTMKNGVPATEAEVLLDRLISDVQENGVTEQEVSVAVRQLTVQLVDSVQTRYGLGQLIGTVMMIFGDPERFANDLEKYLGVTPADVKRVAQKYLQINNRSVVILAPESKKEIEKKGSL